MNPLKWHGGKTYLAKRIIELMPPHTHYVEPYFGGGAVLFAKDPEGVSEVVNDIDGDLMNFWTVIADPGDLFKQFMAIINLTPFSEDAFNKACEFNAMREIQADYKANAAARFFVQYRQSRQGLGKDFATLSRTRTRCGMNEQVSQWLGAIEGLQPAAERLRRVVTLNRPALDVIRQQDGPGTLFYLDPPYLHETRVTTSEYGENEMSLGDHSDLLARLFWLDGKFILSGYRSRLYDVWAESMGWRRVDIEIDNKASSQKTKPRKVESLWLNF